MIQSRSAGHAKAYFSDALSKSDYYVNDQELNGRIQGKIAERLGIEGMATKDVFFALCENKNPTNRQPLTQRTRQERTTGYDINFHCPKSVSILHALSDDKRILEAFEASVRDTMWDIEADSKTRVRKNKAYNDRPTGELVWADFVHQTARPVDGFAPDPHLHAHCFVFNVTWDAEEQKLKAGQYRDIKRDMPYYQARFHKRLSDKVMAAGYAIRKTDKSFEIDGLPQDVIDRFSKRTDEIGRVAKQKGITDRKELDGLGARTRSKKQKGLSMAELKVEWTKQVDDVLNGKEIASVKRRLAPPNLEPSTCIDYAVEHCFERASVMPERRILESACRYSIGSSGASLDQLTETFKNDKRILHVKEKSGTVCTTKEVLLEEQRMVELAKKGKGQITPAYGEPPELNLVGQQKAAAEHILTTANRVSIIRGAAGTGKTTLMKEAVRKFNDAGKAVIVVAPTAAASRGVLKSEGFDKADTVAKLLTDETMQQQLKGQVLFVDEAGLLGTKDMKALLDLVTKQDAQLVLCGDTKQHASVVRGDALRILNTVAKIPVAEVTKIHRQKKELYRSAVEDLSKGDVHAGFEKLDAMGSIKTVDPLKPNEDLVDDYIRTVKEGKTALIISPTHKQGEDVTKAIREKLREEKLIGKKEITYTRLTNLNLTVAEKNDPRNFREGNVVQFNQNLKGIVRGSRWIVDDIENKTVHLKNENGETRTLPRGQGNHFDVYTFSDIALSKGDKIRITHNGFDDGKKRLNNGQTLEVISVSKRGNIIAINTLSKETYCIAKNYAHLAHAHSVTSYASQGKTVDEVFISQPAGTFQATDAKQFYVSVSRARENVRIYTDDKASLLEHATRLGERQSAIEAVSKTTHEELVAQRQREEHFKRIAKDTAKKQQTDLKRNKTKDHDRT